MHVRKPALQRVRLLLALTLSLALLVTALPSAALGAVIDDNFPETAPRLPASPVVGALDGDSEEGDWEDFYKVDLAPGQAVTAKISGPRNNYYAVDLYGPELLTWDWESEEYLIPRGTTVPSEFWDEDEMGAPYPGFPCTATDAGTYYFDLWAGGGHGAYSFTWTVSDQTGLDAKISRKAGADRYATAIEISKRFSTADTVLLATGKNYADALSASGLAGALDAPLLLTDPLALNASVLQRIKDLGATKVIVVGGTGAVFPAVKTTLEANNLTVQRIAGADRYATAALVAAEIKKAGGNVGRAFIVNGYGWPDALAASPLAYSQKMPILLVKPLSVPAVTAAALTSLGVTETVVAGGTGVVTDVVKNSLPHPTRVSGTNRYATSAAVADYGIDRGWATFDAIGIATGANYADALAGGIVTGDKGGVLLLTQQQTVFTTNLKGNDPLWSPATLLTGNAPGADAIDVYGGIGAVSGLVTSEIHKMLP